MKTPICSICLQSNILCASCRRNIDAGKISGRGVGIIKKLYELSKSVKSLDKITIKKVFDFDGLVVVVCDKSDVPSIVGKDGRIVNDLRKSLGKQIKIIGVDEIKIMITNLFFPAKAVRVGNFYSAGLESLKINLDKNQLRNLPASKEELIKAAEEISGMKVHINVQ
ncbi:MAG: hypothetical protein HYT71_01110 [Candidatus Aenigmarchaeota archaeon]|nr:hypothetical protein [Candidatus Aenigmarchaeota archaeon]